MSTHTHTKYTYKINTPHIIRTTYTIHTHKHVNMYAVGFREFGLSMTHVL